MCVSGSLMRSSTWRSSSVSAPCISRSICLPSSLHRSRTMRGSFCQALPIGCMRVFITPSCSSAVTLESRCSGVLNSDSSWRRPISSSWLRVSTSSETMVISRSSVSTETRIDWLPFFWSSSLSTSASGDLGSRRCGGSTGVARKARSRSSSESSPGSSGRSSTCSTRVPTLRSGIGAGFFGSSASAMCVRPAMRSSSAPAGSRCSCSSASRISLMRSMVARISVTASLVAGTPSRKRPISASAACASASSRGRPRKPQVPLMVWTRRKTLLMMVALPGSCSKRTSSTSTTSRLSFVSVTNSRSRSSIEKRLYRRVRACPSFRSEQRSVCR